MFVFQACLSHHWSSDWFSGDYGLQLVLGCSRQPPFNDCTGCRSGKTLTLGVNLQATAIWEEWLYCTFKPLTHIFCREETKLGVIRFHSEPDWSKLDSNRVSMRRWIGFTFCLNGFIWDILRFWRRAGILASVLKMQLFLLTIILCFPKGLIALWAAESIRNPLLLEEVELQMQLLLNSSQLIKKTKNTDDSAEEENHGDAAGCNLGFFPHMLFMLFYLSIFPFAFLMIEFLTGLLIFPWCIYRFYMYIALHSVQYPESHLCSKAR